MSEPLPDHDPCYQLANEGTSLAIDCRHRLPALMYFGPRVRHLAPDYLSLLDRGEAPASPAESAPTALLPDVTSGFLGSPGIALHRGNRCWQFHPEIQAISQPSSRELILEAGCGATQVKLRYEISLDAELPVFSITVRVINDSQEERLHITECNLTLSLPDNLTHCRSFQGRWGLEFQQQRQAISQGAYVRENRSGRSSHQSPPYLMMEEQFTTETSGEALACHLAWSGNYRMCIEQLADGRRFIQMGELLTPGEVELGAGEVYTTPEVWCAVSHEGLGGLSHSWHQLVRRDFSAPAGSRYKARPVQLNTWEALYFDVNESNVLTLIDQAAQLGIERFVLDDGWFDGRQDDSSSLGDWQVDATKFPRGLNPLINACRERGMAFGLWIEPEMVNPDSNLYRANPDWVLHHDPAPRLLARNQLVLDLGRDDVFDHLLGVITTLLGDYDISYLKWDMNRDIHQAGNADGVPAIHRQTRALYRLMGEVKRQFPDLEIESCASGGGRVDFGVLQFASRFWPSDSHDALDRLRIQQGFSLLMPPELMGSHVGAATCHLTGRQHAMAFRAGVAFWGHLGVEMDLSSIDDADKQTLSSLIALHKRHRALLHAGRTLRLERPEGEMGWAIINHNQTEALFAAVRLHSTVDIFPRRFRFSGLDADAHYRVQLVWPQVPDAELGKHSDAIQSSPLSGDALGRLGIQLPILAPETLLIYHLERV